MELDFVVHLVVQTWMIGFGKYFLVVFAELWLATHFVLEQSAHGKRGLAESWVVIHFEKDSGL